MEEGVIFYINNRRELRIYELLKNMSYIPLIEHFDFTTIGLRTETPVYGNGGVKISSSYTMNGNEVVKKLFSYVDDGVWVEIVWMKKDGSTGIKKTIFKPLNIVEIHKINKSNRDRTITYLQASAIGTPIENYVNDILKFCKNEIDLFIYNNTDDFKEKIENTILEPYRTYLNDIIVEAPSEQYPTGKTVKDSILQQIN